MVTASRVENPGRTAGEKARKFYSTTVMIVGCRTEQTYVESNDTRTFFALLAGGGGDSGHDIPLCLYDDIPLCLYEYTSVMKRPERCQKA